MLHGKAWAATMTAAGTALLLALTASPASAQGSWTITAAPPTGQNGELAGVAAVSDTDAWAVGSTGAELNTTGAHVLIDNWNGTHWTQSSAPATPGNTGYLADVSASSATDAWAVGHTSEGRDGFEPLALHWNGTSWAVSSTGLSASSLLYGVADISPTDAYAFGDAAGDASGYVAQWNGTTWSRVTVPIPTETNLPYEFDAIAADGQDDVWVLGYGYVLTSSTSEKFDVFSLHFNGTSWSAVLMPESNSAADVYNFDALHVNSPTDVWAVGGIGDGIGIQGTTLIEHWNGTAWSVVPSPSPGSGDGLSGVTTSNASDDVWAVGSYVPSGSDLYQPLILNWNGTAWSTVTSPAISSDSSLSDVSTNPGASIVWAVGTTGVCCTENPLILQNG
jgi:hypothetical protein